MDTRSRSFAFTGQGAAAPNRKRTRPGGRQRRITAALHKSTTSWERIGKISGHIREAFHIAWTGRPGPVHVDLPKRLLVFKEWD